MFMDLNRGTNIIIPFIAIPSNFHQKPPKIGGFFIFNGLSQLFNNLIN